MFNWCLSYLKSNYLLFGRKIFSKLVRTALFYDIEAYKMKKLRYPGHLKRESELNLAIQFDLYTLSFNSTKLYHY